RTHRQTRRLRGMISRLARNLLEIPRPRNTKPALEGGPVSRQSRGEMLYDNRILPENLNRCKLFLSRAPALPEIVRLPFTGHTPKGEPMPLIPLHQAVG